MRAITKIMLWIIGVVVTLIAAGSLVAWSLSAPAYRGEKSDHFDGKRFLNPDSVEARGFGDLLKWAFNRDQGPWEMRADAPIHDIPASPSDSLETRITFVNHSTFLIQCEGSNILTDPIWSDRASPFQWAGPRRMRPPGIRFEDLPRIDAVVLSHNHYDHLDAATAQRLASAFDPVFFVPLGVGAYLERLGIDRIRELDWWQQALVDNEVMVTAVPANHFSGRGAGDRDATLWCGYVIGTPAGKIYFAGDTGYGSFFPEIAVRCGPVDVAILPIGAYKPRWFMSPIHTSPEEAAAIHNDVGAQYSLAMHFGTFPLADDGQHEPVDDLYAALRKHGIDPHRFLVLEEGTSFSYGPDGAR